MNREIVRIAKVSLLALTLFHAICGIGQVSVLTQHNDNARTGQNLNETTLNTSNVNQSSFGKLFWRTVDGFIYAQPLYVPELTIQGATHNVVYVATQHNSVYAFDADDPNAPAPLWQVNLGTPVPSQDICIITGDTNPGDCPYYDISPEIGITSTPAIDPVAGIIYVVNRTKNTSNSTYHDYIHALNLTTGIEELGGPIEITGQVSGTGTGSQNGVVTFDPTYHHQRPSLLLLNGVLYLGFGSVGDIGTWHGWVMSYNATTLQQEAIFGVAPDGSEGGVWSAGQGPVADTAGNVYFMTGNGDFNANLTGGRNYGDSFVKFSGSSLTVADYFTPSDQGTLNADNTDLGSGGPMLMPGTSLLVGMGKDAIFRVVDTTNMGKYNSSVDNDVQEFTATTNGFYSSPVYWNSPNNGPVVYIWGAADYLKAFKFTGSQFNTTPVSQSTIQNSSGQTNSAALSVSANGSQTGSGIVWSSASLSGWASGVQVPGVMRAFDATNLTSELWDSTQNLARDDVGTYAKWSPPTIANGKVYVGSFSGQLQVYGLNPPAFQGVRFVQVASATPQSTTASVSVTYPGSQAAGDLNVVIVGWNDSTATVQSVTDSAGNSYALAIGPTTGTALRQSIYYAKNIVSNSANTVTVTFNQGAAKPDVRILEYSGVDLSSPLDVSAGASGNSNIADSGYVATSAANELIVGASMAHSNTTIMAGAPFTPRIITSPDSDVAEDRLVNAPGSYHSWAPLNASGNWVMQVVTFQAAAGSTVPFVNSVSPNNGPVAGGTAVTITGTNFAAGGTVTFGGTAATNVAVVNSTTITATTPAGTSGTVTVTVTVNGQSGSLTNGYTYVAAPTVSSVSPNSGTTAGGTAVTITGTNFAAGGTVTFGGTAATNVAVVNSTTITATTPAGTAGAVTVTVTVNGQSGSLTNGFTYVVGPTVSSVSPNYGPPAGGTAVTITGTNFAAGATVTFGGTAATNVAVVNSTTITATTPAGTAGAVTVTVTVNGQSGSLTNGFTYVVPPTVSSVSPNSGTTAGGTAVTITGTNFASGATVTFGGTAATNVAVVNSTTITATTPAGTAGAVTVTVTNPGGQSGSFTNGYTYVVAPTVSSVTPNNGPVAGGTAVTITGTNFAAGATVTFGGTAATNVVVVNSTNITATTPAGNAGAVTVTVTVNGQSGSLTNGFTYTGTVAISFTQVASATPQTPTATVAVSYPGAQTAGNLNVVVVGWNDNTATVQSVGDSAGNNYSLAIGPTSGTGLQQSIYFAPHIVGGSNTVTVTFSQAAAYPDVRILEYRGVTALDVTAGTSGSNAAASSGAATTTSANELIFGANTVATGNAAAGSGFTARIITPMDGDLAEDEIVTTAGSNSATATLTGSGPWVMQMATFAAVSGPVPTVSSVAPSSGTTAGGPAVTITGTNFVAGATVTFGGTAATNVAVVNGTTITATTPVGSAGVVTVTVTNPGGQSGSLASAFTYIAPPTVSGVAPNSGSLAGGTAVTITGTSFAAGATVTFGGTAATNVAVVNSTTITATTPAGTSGAVTVTVSNSNGLSGSLANAFTYAGPPTVGSISPNSGTTLGGTAVTITGTNFYAGATVTFGGASATNVAVVNSTTINATTPAGTSGAETVTVTVSGQSGSLTNGFTYVVGPTVSSAAPNNGPVAGGTAVTITGTNFAAGATVTFGGTAATNIAVVNSTTITATTPAGTSGAVTVTVTVNGQSGSLTNGYTYVAVPTVSSVSPNSGTTAGGTAVTITGTNFAAGATVTLGGTAATNVAVVNGTTITATTPAGTAGAVTVTVTVSGQSGSLTNGYTYVVGPTVSSVAPNNGPVAGGTAVTITGTNFAAGATVTFGGTAATNVAIVNSTTITATTPAHAAGAVAVAVTVNGQSGSLTNGFTYGVAPTVTSVAPTSGTMAGGTAVTIRGTNFVAGATVTFGGTAATNVVVTNSTTITATTPAGNAGAVTVTVTVNGQSGSLTNGYTYVAVPTVTSVSPTSGTTAGGTAVTITGTNFATGATVKFATTAATNVVVVNSTTITATTPAHAAGAVAVAVTVNGQSGSLTNGFTYVAPPTVTSVAPTSGTTVGGTAVTIRGTNFVAGATVTFGGTAATNVVVTNSTTITATTPAGNAGAVTVTVTVNGQSGSLTNGYTYVAVPTVTSVSPTSGTTAGGTAVTITGTNFATGATVKFATTAATNVVVVNSTTITATTPAHAAGAVAVAVTVNGQSGSLTNGFTYVAPPTVTSVAPTSGTTVGGTAVTIRGTNFVAGATVTFGGTAATNVVVTNSTTITATTPAGNAGAVTVTVTVNGQSGSLTNGYTYVAVPTVTSVSPTSGTTAGGTAVTITGTNFATGATVKFATTAATNVVVVNSTTITTTTPAHAAGAVAVAVTVNGQSGSLTNGFTYVAPPTVTSVAPTSGTTVGGTAVTIRGTNFVAGATVTFGGTAATNVVVTNSTTITATTPAGTSGAVTVTVTVNGVSGSLTNGFTYVVGPTVSSVSPNYGPPAGGTAVTITGTNFATGATVTFGGTAATNVVVVNSSTITATTPAGSAGAVTVTVTVNGQSGSLANGFSYVVPPTVSSVSPTSGTTAGGTAVTITGTNFAAGATVTFGGTAATNVAIVNSTTITATTPAGSAGAVTVTVTNPGGQSGSLTNGYTYVVGPTVSSAAPNNGPVAGGTAVTITGTNFAAGATVTFGGTAATNVAVVNSTTITATTPARTSGAVTVTVTVSGQSGSLTNGYTYVAVPTVSSVSPNSGTTAGGTAVTITGTNFAAGATVTFGGTAATNVAVVNGTTITATTPAGTAGAVTVTVTVSGQSGSLTNGFSYVVPPTVSSVSPNSGTTAGGTAVTITGTNFAAGATVTFGGTAATNVAIVNSTTITATTPAGSAGAVTVTVTVNGQSGSLTNGYTYVAVPTVSNVAPNNGPVAGGTAVTITGTNFAAGGTVTFGGTAATNVAVVNSTTITATTPAGTSGTVTVTVTVNGQSGSLTNGYTYVAAPTVSSVSPNSGTTAGGTAVTITGTNFAAGGTVTFGGTAATNVAVVNSTTITATTPAGTAGAVTVTVTVNGQSGSLTNGFTYVVGPTVSSVSPNYGPPAGGTAVTITGTNFAAGATVTFGGTAATNVAVVNSTTITATTPAGTAGAVTVTVTVNGQSGSLTNGFTYVVPPTVSSVSPNSGTTAGGTAVTITGTNFASGATVTFGGTAATNVAVVNSTTITATTPAGTAGAVTVTVTNPGGQSGSFTNGYTYVVAPTVSSVTPNNGPVAGGTAVTITGTNFAAGATVTFGGTAATNVVVVNSTNITATTPAGNAGAVTVTVTVNGQSGSLTNGFTYTGTVAISFTQVASATPQTPTATVAVSYPGAQTAGNLNVVVVGWNDNTATVQSVGDSAGNNYSLAIGPTSGTGLQQSIYFAPHIVGGSNTVTVTFSQAAAYPDVRILEYRGVTALDVTAGTSGSNAAASSGAATTTSANELIFGANTVATGNAAAGSGFTARIITPMDGDLAEDEIVTTAGSNSATATLTGSGPWVMQMATFAAVSGPVPTVSSVAPSSGTTAGGPAVTITGTNFVAGATVTFGGTAATNVAVVNGTTITATTPVGSAGVVTVTVTNPGGQSGSLASAFTYIAPPTVSGVAPNSGSLAGGTAVTITGTSFAAGATVTFGGTAATNVAVVNSTTITATTPAGTSGAVTVTVSNSNGLSGSLANAFTYAGPPTVGSISPNSGTTLGGTAVTITGTNFYAGATVTFGGASATNVAVVNSTTINATTPAGTSGAETVTVTVSGQSGSLTNGYTFIVTQGITAPSSFVGALMGTSAPTYVAGQEYYNATSGTSFTTAPFNSTGADLLVMFVGCHNNTTFTITDSYGNTWLPLAGPAYKVGTAYYPMEGEFFYAPNATTGAGHTITVGLSQSEPLVLSIAALSGDNIYSPIDAYSFITGDNGTIAEYIASSPLTTSQPNDLLVGIVKGFSNNTYTAGNGYTARSASTGLNFSAETGTASSTGSYNSSFTASVSDFWQTVLAAIAPNPNEAVLSWTASTGGIIANYYIERCTGLGCASFNQIASVSSSTLSYTDTTISSGTVYNYRVRAEDTSGTYSDYSNVQALSPIIPHVVSSFTATPVRTLAWNASAENGGSISQYSIERCTGIGCSGFSQIATTSSTSYTDTSAAAGTTYNYRVRAQDVNNFYGPYSVAAAANIPAYLDNAAGGGTNGGNTLSLTYSYTVGTNFNQLLLVNVIGDSSADDISSVTYAGAQMTLITKVHTPGDLWHYLYYLLAPTSGTHNAVVTAATSHFLASEAASWYNVAQSGQPQAYTTNTAASGVSMTTSLPASSNNAIVTESMWSYTGLIPSSGSTPLVVDSASDGLGIFSSIPSPVTQAFPVSMTNTWGGQGPASSIMASFTLASNGTPGITYDNSADGGNNSGSTASLTYSYTVGTGPNRLLVVNLIGDTSADDISSVTYAGIPLTLVGKIRAPSNNWQYLYYLLNPSSGSHNVVVTAGSPHYLISQSASWYNVMQSGQPDASTTNTAAATSTSITTSLTTVATGSLVVQGIWSYGHLAAGSGASPILTDAAFDGAGIFASNGSPVSPPGNVSMTTICDGSSSSGVIMVSFAPAP